MFNHNQTKIDLLIEQDFEIFKEFQITLPSLIRLNYNFYGWIQFNIITIRGGQQGFDLAMQQCIWA